MRRGDAASRYALRLVVSTGQSLQRGLPMEATIANQCTAGGFATLTSLRNACRATQQGPLGCTSATSTSTVHSNRRTSFHSCYLFMIVRIEGLQAEIMAFLSNATFSV